MGPVLTSLVTWTKLLVR